jgi:predicted metalloprotease with PDZ domain
MGRSICVLQFRLEEKLGIRLSLATGSLVAVKRSNMAITNIRHQVEVAPLASVRVLSALVRRVPGEKLGLRLHSASDGESCDVETVIHTLTAGNPTATASPQLRVGDVVLAINGNSTVGLSHSSKLKLLSTSAENMLTVTVLRVDGSETIVADSTHELQCADPLQESTSRHSG